MANMYIFKLLREHQIKKAFLQSITIQIITVWVLVEIFFILTMVENRSESDDGFWYAQSVRDNSFHDLFFPRMPFFLPLMKSLFLVATYLFPNIDCYTFLCFISTLAASSIVVLVYFYCKKILKVESIPALVISGSLVFSYGFWRYAFEVEVYPLASLLVLIGLIILVSNKELSYKRLIILGIIGSLATLLYKPSFIPFFLCFPFGSFLKNWKKWISYYSIGGVLTCSGYYTAFKLMSNPPENFLTFIIGGTTPKIGSLPESIFIVSSNFISLNWAFNVDSFVVFIQNKFPFKVIEEEVFTADHSNLVTLNICVFILLIIFIVLLTKYSIKNWKKFPRLHTIYIVPWLITNSIIILLLDPSSNEPWLMLQVPFILIFGWYFIAPLKSLNIIICVFLLSLFLNNYFGGIYLYQQKESDLYFAKSKWLIEHSEKESTILSLGPVSFIRYLGYSTEANIINIEENLIDAKIVLEQHNEPIYLTQDVFLPQKAIYYRSRSVCDELSQIIQGYSFELINTNNGFKTYKLLPKTSPI